ncbi:MAG: pantoate--beta-alanine ligase [Burkholderiaceae bacterium]
MQIHETIESFRTARAGCGQLAFVPTMGNLHDGHIALVHRAAASAETVAASIFVNRLQFGAGEDFDRYPRTFEGDCAKLRAAGVAHLFAPDESVMYPQPQTYHVDPAPGHVNDLEGAARAGHFRGVATVVLKLFSIVRPDLAMFGKKDYQQLLMISAMVRQFALPIRIVPCETVRAPDGLALSSRNGYLSAPERAEAPRLQRVLAQIARAVRSGERRFATLETQALEALRQAGWAPDYVSVRDAQTLSPPGAGSHRLVVLGAARLGHTRLLDNIEI